VQHLVEFVLSGKEFSESDVYAALTVAGVPDTLADRAYKFTQIAWGQFVFSQLGVQFSQKYVCLDANGGVLEEGRLPDEACFAAAYAMARKHGGAPGVKRLALMSADAQAINELFRRGSKTENMRMAPSILFLEPPTQAGLEEADRLSLLLITPVDEKTKTSSSPSRKWWRFWS